MLYFLRLYRIKLLGKSYRVFILVARTFGFGVFNPENISLFCSFTFTSLYSHKVMENIFFFCNKNCEVRITQLIGKIVTPVN